MVITLKTDELFMPLITTNSNLEKFYRKKMDELSKSHNNLTQV